MFEGHDLNITLKSEQDALRRTTVAAAEQAKKDADAAVLAAAATRKATPTKKVEQPMPADAPGLPLDANELPLNLPPIAPPLSANPALPAPVSFDLAAAFAKDIEEAKKKRADEDEIAKAAARRPFR